MGSCQLVRGSAVRLVTPGNDENTYASLFRPMEDIIQIIRERTVSQVGTDIDQHGGHSLHENTLTNRRHARHELQDGRVWLQ